MTCPPRALFFLAPIAFLPQAPGEVRSPPLLDVPSGLGELIHDEALGLYPYLRTQFPSASRVANGYWKI
jgi:hypothetical protein